MVAIKAAGADAFVARPDPNVFCFLVYGPDSGLVAERAAHLAKSAVDDPNDAFSLVRIDGDDLASDPERLLDEAHTVALFGGRRAIWIRAGSRPIQAAVEKLLAGPAPDARIVVEAGNLGKGAPLRTMCEKSPKAAALPCFADNEAGISKLIDKELGEAGLKIDPNARQALLALLGADRMATRQEIDKLALYAHGEERVTLAHVDAAVADVSAVALDDAVDAAFAGNTDGLERGLAALDASGIPASAALLAALRHAIQLHKVRASGQEIERAWPHLHFRRKGLVEMALSRFSTARMDAAVQRLAQAVLEGRRSGALGETIARRALASIALEAKRR
ncbi:DNA polymerase III subunit delta [Terrihabitans soli]|uniref:DNA polymerase III subunit delta n=1 Tax=Terrihabitans soli TaxID=708113 RepID=A0A6S6QN13_9HYPH|nr:DNA polymerase III subunit delta [Terrihabitans soli]BCJ89307.1 DNA polymerase III subunit delta [Terrihabitans soli]